MRKLLIAALAVMLMSPVAFADKYDHETRDVSSSQVEKKDQDTAAAKDKPQKQAKKATDKKPAAKK